MREASHGLTISPQEDARVQGRGPAAAALPFWLDRLLISGMRGRGSLLRSTAVPDSRDSRDSLLTPADLFPSHVRVDGGEGGGDSVARTLL